jgi:RNA:NAD 2'-phosphotransferase (TPT1/KptA family)
MKYDKISTALMWLFIGYVNRDKKRYKMSRQNGRIKQRQDYKAQIKVTWAKEEQARYYVTKTVHKQPSAV